MVRCFDGLSTGQVTTNGPHAFALMTNGPVPFALSLSKRLSPR
jgi:hypothetical protein